LEIGSAHFCHKYLKRCHEYLKRNGPSCPISRSKSFKYMPSREKSSIYIGHLGICHISMCHVDKNQSEFISRYQFYMLKSSSYRCYIVGVYYVH